jgi:hypothetical protein
MGLALIYAQYNANFFATLYLHLYYLLCMILATAFCASKCDLLILSLLFGQSHLRAYLADHCYEPSPPEIRSSCCSANYKIVFQSFLPTVPKAYTPGCRLEQVVDPCLLSM